MCYNWTWNKRIAASQITLNVTMDCVCQYVYDSIGFLSGSLLYELIWEMKIKW